MINETIERLPAEIVQGYRNLLRHDSITCAISDCMGRFNAMTSDMKPLFEGARLVGSAITVRTLASDLAAAFKAIDICKPGDVNVPIQCGGVAVSPGDVVVVDGNGVVVVPMAQAALILELAERLLATEHLLQEKIKAGATIGELINVDEVFRSTFSYQNRAMKHG